ncbi:hypothetical protein AAG570_003149 [Ranatra chinensis]|uniref:Uncharacterized protein n=1 Tax=Ranatra chinensis TaxID=642074 RepID=A0ABD0Y5X1_9HEMI
MASKRRNMFYKNKKQETTEIGTGNLPPFCDCMSCRHSTRGLAKKKAKHFRARHQSREHRLGSFNLNKLNFTGRSKASPKPLRRIRVMMANTCEHFNSLSPRLTRQINCNEVQIFEKKFDFVWVPKNQLNWYREHVKCLDKKQKVMILLTKLHEGLQNYSATFQMLRKGPHDIVPDCDDTRQEMIKNVADKLLLLLCEVDRTIVQLRLPPPQRLTDPVSRHFLLGERWDYTTRHLYEWGVLLVYQVFLEDWNRIIKNLVGRKGDRRCKRRRPLVHHHSV